MGIYKNAAQLPRCERESPIFEVKPLFFHSKPQKLKNKNKFFYIFFPFVTFHSVQSLSQLMAENNLSAGENDNQN
jgi:hypothetical protein